ncbi:hypothetical protein QFC22_000017 [Naganishia vaughanmartiniae]|uniref:Uncharacterized protein n=1 Tax=Naganishia vaughanmartiniae TaxID=1424756 RepID=A0ACC2XLY9_9TREE|nr:hypothetical protein QFC22_000017 [Naganishia vaughanmartiniae]
MFTNQLASNFRTETINVTDVVLNQGSMFESFFIQGSQRWQSVRLTQGSSLTLQSVGFRPTSATTAQQDSKGNATVADTHNTFECSNDMYNRIWALGPKSLQHACVRAETQPSTWVLNTEQPDNGVFIRGQRAARSANLTGALPANYTFSFETKIARGGFGFQLDAGLGGTGPLFYVVSNLPDETTFSTWNETLLPRNNLVLGAGFAIVNQTTLPGYLYDQIPLNNVPENEWLKIAATSEAGGIYTISINDQQVAGINYTSYGYLPGPSPFYLGPTSIGIGGWQGQDAYYRKLKVTFPNGTVLYENAMDNDDILAEYGVLQNPFRLVWLGDFYIAATSIAVSTADYDVYRGTLESSLEHASVAGAVGISNPMGISDKYAQAYVGTGSLILSDYQLDFLNSVYLYVESTGDTDWLKNRWSAIQKQIQWSSSFLNPETQLWAPLNVFKGAPNGTAASSQFVWTLHNMASLADTLGDTNSSAIYKQQADATAQAINQYLWNATTGTYEVSLTDGNYSYIDMAMSIIAGVSTGDKTTSQLEKLASLTYGLGYLQDSSVIGSNETTLSPYLGGYLLDALGMACRSKEMMFLLDNLWTSMARPGEDYSGGAWEYVFPDGKPGLSVFTSLAHPWGSGATAALTRYALGLRPTAIGYIKWTFAPVELNLTHASGCIDTPQGEIKASWSTESGKLVITVDAPAGTTGVVVPHLAGTYDVGGKKGQTGQFAVQGGSKVTIKQE